MPSLRFMPLIVVALVTIQGCAPSIRQVYLKNADRPDQAVAFFNELDNIVEAGSKENVAYARVPGFPYLKADRFLAELKNHLTSESRRNDWVRYLQKRDLEVRHSEINALSQKEIERLLEKTNISGPSVHSTVYEYYRRYSKILYEHDKQRQNFVEALMESVFVADDYSTAMRTFGLYPLAYLPVVYFSDRAFDKIRDWHQLPLDAFNNQGDLISYKSALSNSNINASAVLGSADYDSFGLPVLSDQEIQLIAQAYAPVILQDTAADYDRIGTFEWKGTQPTLNTESATVYYYLTYGLIEKQPVIQINYSFWYTEREGELAPWFEKGEFDGLTIRFSLTRTGDPVMLDIMNNCGCYHFFVPNAEFVQSVKELDFEIDPLVPKWLPKFDNDSPLLFRVNSGWHQVEHIASEKLPTDSLSYELVPYKALEALPTPQGNTVNLFDEEGIMKESYRIEPYIFFSMGIPKVGYMRQRGNHPIKMLGRDHFDNPLLFNRNFTFNKLSDTN